MWDKPQSDHVQSPPDQGGIVGRQAGTTNAVARLAPTKMERTPSAPDGRERRARLARRSPANGLTVNGRPRRPRKLPYMRMTSGSFQGPQLPS